MDILKALEGKKTNIAAGVLLALAVAGFLTGHVSDVNAIALAAFALAAFGLGDKSDRYGKLLIEIAGAAKEKKLSPQLVGEVVEVATEAAAESVAKTQGGK
jgi:hypothetical protein